MMKAIIFLFIMISSNLSFGSALVTKDDLNKKLLIEVNLHFYGTKDTTLAETCFNEIQSTWGQEKIAITLDKEEYEASFLIKSRSISRFKAQVAIKLGRDIRENYIELVESESRIGLKNPDGYLPFVGANTGAFNSDLVNSPFFACSHEFGHIIGIGERNNPRNEPSMMTQAGVMTPFVEFQNHAVDEVYRSFNSIGTFNQRLRKIGPVEYDSLERGISHSTFKNGKANLGKLTRKSTLY